jgi:hypothetical protein
MKNRRWVGVAAVASLVLVAAGSWAGSHWLDARTFNAKHFPRSAAQWKKLSPQLKSFIEVYRKEVENCSKEAACSTSIRPNTVVGAVYQMSRAMGDAATSPCDKCAEFGGKRDQCVKALNEGAPLPSCP